LQNPSPMRTINIEFEEIEYEVEVEAWIVIEDHGFGTFDWGTHHDYQPVVDYFKIESCKGYDEDGNEKVIEDTDFLYEEVEKYINEHKEQFEEVEL